jgi:hypothetical protein
MAVDQQRLLIAQLEKNTKRDEGCYWIREAEGWYEAMRWRKGIARDALSF